MADPLCLDVKETAAALGISPSAVRDYIDRGLLPVVRLPGKHQGERSRRVLVAVADLRDFIQRHREVAHTPDAALSAASLAAWERRRKGAA